MLIVLVRAILLYILIIFSIRLMGKRQLGDLQPAELAITILISNMATLAIENTSISMVFAAIPILALVAFELILSTITLKSKKLRDIVSGSSVVIIENGKIIQENMKKLRLSIDDLMEGIRGNSIFDIQDIEYAIVETTGKISILQKFEAQNATPKILSIKGEEVSPPLVLISDTKLIEQTLKIYNLGMQWLEQVLKSNNTYIENVFLMTVDKNANYYIVEKNKKS